jgi:hypothetical protein
MITIVIVVMINDVMMNCDLREVNHDKAVGLPVSNASG